jgi:hypothetical protein
MKVARPVELWLHILVHENEKSVDAADRLPCGRTLHDRRVHVASIAVVPLPFMPRLPNFPDSDDIPCIHPGIRRNRSREWFGRTPMVERRRLALDRFLIRKTTAFRPAAAETKRATMPA